MRGRLRNLDAPARTRAWRMTKAAKEIASRAHEAGVAHAHATDAAAMSGAEGVRTRWYVASVALPPRQTVASAVDTQPCA